LRKARFSARSLDHAVWFFWWAAIPRWLDDCVPTAFICLNETSRFVWFAAPGLAPSS